MEWFNKTLKHMLKKVMEVDEKNWDQLLPHVLFTIREVPQASTSLPCSSCSTDSGPEDY